MKCTKLSPSLQGIHYHKPSLSVLPSPVVTSGRNMTLQCVSWVRYENLILTKENEKLTSSLNAQYIHPTGNYQVLFSIENMTPDHAGTFRCYGYYKNTPHLWSVPSEPLEIHILGESTLSLTNCFLRQQTLCHSPLPMGSCRHRMATWREPCSESLPHICGDVITCVWQEGR